MWILLFSYKCILHLVHAFHTHVGSYGIKDAILLVPALSNSCYIAHMFYYVRFSGKEMIWFKSDSWH